jgi:C4-dicarboxylate-specific signal transduction histidine kinase
LKVSGPLPFRRQVALAACVLLLPLIAAIVIAARHTRSERQAEVREAAISVAVTAAASLDEALRGLDALAAGLVRHPSVALLDGPASAELFSALLHDQPVLTNIALVDAQGALLSSALDVTGDRIDRPWVTQVLTQGAPQISDFQVGRVSGKPVVALAYPVRSPQGVTNGAIALWVDLTRLQNAFARIPLPEGSVVTVFDTSSRVMVRSREPEKYIGQTIASLDWSALPRSGSRVDLDGVERFTGDTRAQRAPWMVSVGIPMAIVPTRLSPLRQRNIAISVVALLGSLALMLWISQSTSRDLEYLRQAVTRIALGDLSAPRPRRMTSREVSDLQAAFVTMAGNLRKVRSDLDVQIDQERKTNEQLQALQQQVIRHERLAAVGVLASGLAHELNNPLQAMVGGAELIKRRTPDPVVSAEVDLIKDQCLRASNVVRGLARFAGPTAPSPAAVCVSEVAADVAQVAAAAMPSVATTLVDTGAHRSVVADAAELGQVILSLVINAQQALENTRGGEGRITIRVADAGANVRVEVEDNGPGVSPDDESKLFQPFFTTRETGAGIGLGLPVSYGIVRSFGGTIGYSRNALGGATFYFELPAIDAGPIQSDDRQAVLQRRA